MNIKDKFLNIYTSLPKKKKITNHKSDIIDYVKFYNLLTFNRNKIPPENEAVIQKILSDLEFLYNILLDLNTIGIHFSLYLVGGSIRDLLLGNQLLIKDLDILFIHEGYYPAPKHTTLKKIGFNTKNYPDWNKIRRRRQVTPHETKLYHILNYFLSSKINVIKSFAPFDKELESLGYIERRLKGVIKIEDTRLNYPIDLLLSNSDVNSFIDSFDINLCKAAVEIVNYKYTKVGVFRFPQNSKDFYSEIITNKYFLKDAYKKELTIHYDLMSFEELVISINNHLPRLIEKYPNYNVVFILINEPEYNINDTSYNEYITKLNTYIKNWQLEQKLLKEINSNNKKITIKSNKI